MVVRARCGAHRCPAPVGAGSFVLAQAGAGGNKVEHLDHLGAQAAGEPAVAADRVLPGDAALLVRGGAQRQPCEPSIRGG